MCEHDSSASRDGQKHQRSSISPPSAPWRKSSSSAGDRWRRRMLGTALKRGRRPRCWRCRGKLAALRGDAGENAARAGQCAREASATAPRDADARFGKCIGVARARRGAEGIRQRSFRCPLELFSARSFLLRAGCSARPARGCGAAIASAGTLAARWRSSAMSGFGASAGRGSVQAFRITADAVTEA